MGTEDEINSENSQQWQPIYLNLGKKEARLLSLVLDSRGIPCCLENPQPGKWLLSVPQTELSRAKNEISAYEQNNRNWPPLLPPSRPTVENSLATLSVLILLATFYNIVSLDIVLPGGVKPDWLAAGSAVAGRILDGEWWRVVTALTLHRDLGHLLGNLGIGGFFIYMLCRELGSGSAWFLIISSGAIGNLVNAWLQNPDHNSIGASTAVFGTIGILAVINLIRYRNSPRKRWVMPVAAALALLVLLGSEGKQTDLGAHFFGFIAGMLAGVANELIISRCVPNIRLMNAVLAICAGAAMIISWIAAVANS